MSAAPLRWRERARRCRAQRGRFFQRLNRENWPDPRWLEMLNAENIQTIILDRHEDRGLLRLLRHSPQWIVDFADRHSVILMRATEPSMIELG
ncbi:MAG: hypothetical protein JXA21_27135 [Anaerolineae bacterium]|nr:hypothetical protein [Anaerolineae bacterium]